MLTKQSQAYQAIQIHQHALREGIVIAIDPSIGSSSSMPGWAVYQNSVLIKSGTLQINPTGTIPERLHRLAYLIRKLYKEWDPDILVYEEIPSQRYGGGNANAHASLLKAVGVILSISGPEGYVGLTPLSWKKMTRPEYVKSDEADAIEMGWIAIDQALRMEKK